MSARIEDNPFWRSARYEGKKIHFGISGSVACCKAVELLRAWTGMGITVSATLTDGAAQFITPILLRALGARPVYDGMFQGGAFDHLEPGKTSDCMVVAPASADIVAKLANGIADEMLCAQFVAFGGACVIAPAMNPAMWRHPATQTNAHKLAAYGCHIVEPGVGGTACGDEGKGRLAPLPEVFLRTLKALSPADMADLKVMVTLGPTREPWDGARFWSNPASGVMGAALATAAWLRGADVTAICGPVSHIFLPEGVKRVHVTTAREMFNAASKLWPKVDMGVFNAAVADFAPSRPEGAGCFKFKKDGAGEDIIVTFTRNPDILATLAGKRCSSQKVLGFAAEITPDMDALLPFARTKLKNKNADIIAANRVNADGGAFGAGEVALAVVDKDGREEIWPAQNKADQAWNLLSWLLKM